MKLKFLIIYFNILFTSVELIHILCLNLYLQTSDLWCLSNNCKFNTLLISKYVQIYIKISSHTFT